MSEEPKWKKINDKKYQRYTEDGYVNVDVPYAKVELVFTEFINNNGLIDVETGLVKTDILTLVRSFGTIGDILLTEFGPDGTIVKEGNARILGMGEIFPLYEIAVDVIQAFMQAVSETVGAPKAPAETADVKEKAPRKPKP